MSNDDPRGGFFYPTFTLIIYSYIIMASSLEHQFVSKAYSQNLTTRQYAAFVYETCFMFIWTDLNFTFYGWI